MHQNTQQRPGWLMNTFQFLLMMLIPALLVISSARMVMSPLFTQVEYTRAGFPPDPYGFSTEDRLEYGILGIEYLLNGDGIEFLGERELPGALCYPPQDEACTMFTSLELQHMEDVKIVAQGAFIFGVVGLIVAIILMAILWQSENRKHVYRAMLQGGLLTLGLIATVVLLAITAWDLFFTKFHDVFFEPGTWQFYYWDTLIRLYPEQFWFDAALTIGVLTTIGASMLVGISWRQISRKVG